MTTVTIKTAKGSHNGTVRTACEWQAEMQGACATLVVGDTEIDVDNVDFDAEDIDATVAAVMALIAEEADAD